MTQQQASVPGVDPQVQQQTDQFRRDYRTIKAEIGKAIVGHEEIIDGVLTCLFVGGHALLEAMQEKQVTAGGSVRKLEEPFFVMATQNPLEQEGTYPLPEAQLDRFFFKLLVQYSGRDELKEILNRTTTSRQIDIQPVL